MKHIKIDAVSSAYKASAMGNLIQKGIYQQVGMIRTMYKHPDGSITKSIESVVRLVKSGVLYAVEQHRGLAISVKIGDPAMLVPMHEWLDTHSVENGEGFVYDQVINYGVEEIDRGKVESSIALLKDEEVEDAETN